METEGREEISLELKYCERCGGLWVRRLASMNIYCAPCGLAMAEVAVSRRRKVTGSVNVLSGQVNMNASTSKSGSLKSGTV